MRSNIAAYIPTLNSGPFQTLNSSDAIMAEVMPVHVQEQAEQQEGINDGERRSHQASASSRR